MAMADYDDHQKRRQWRAWPEGPGYTLGE
ncbi:hypothetical protein SDJN02_12200, partial [Cucurbita argyrosperma subsp. argyrosperma]